MYVYVSGNKIMFFKYKVVCKLPEIKIDLKEIDEKKMKTMRALMHFQRVEDGILARDESELSRVTAVLKEAGIEYTVVDVSPPPEVVEKVKDVVVGSKTEALRVLSEILKSQ